MKLLAQTAEAVQLGTQFVDTAGGFGGAVWILSLVIGAIIVLAGIYIWQISLPNAKANRENSQKLADAIVVMGRTTTDTLSQVRHSGGTIDETQSAIRAMASCRGAECAALQKLADRAGVDVSAELGEIRGTMRAAAEIVSK